MSDEKKKAKRGPRNMLTATEWKRIEDANRKAEHEPCEDQLTWLPRDAGASQPASTPNKDTE